MILLQNNPRKPKVSIHIIKNAKKVIYKNQKLNTNNQKCKNKKNKKTGTNEHSRSLITSCREDRDEV